MTVAAASPRIIGAVCALALTAGALAACTPTPEPSPTPTALFSSDEEAFAAAEETYRAYTEATNETELDDPKTVEGVYDWLISPAEDAARENYSAYQAENITRSGDSTFDTFTPVSNADELVTVRLCIDVSKVDLTDAAGNSVVPPDRVDRAPIEVEFVTGDTSTGLVIRSYIRTSEISC